MNVRGLCKAVKKVRNKFVYNDVNNKIAHLRGLFDTFQLDILCLAEIKLDPVLCEGFAANFKDCHCYFSCEPTGAHKHGVAVLARKKKLDVISYNGAFLRSVFLREAREFLKEVLEIGLVDISVVSECIGTMIVLVSDATTR